MCLYFVLNKFLFKPKHHPAIDSATSEEIKLHSHDSLTLQKKVISSNYLPENILIVQNNNNVDEPMRLKMMLKYLAAY